MNLQQKLEFIRQYIPGSSDDIAMMVHCHVNTLRKIISGDENIRLQTYKNIDSLYNKALEVKKVMES